MKNSISRRDVYKKNAVNEGWRARSAYKLIQIEEELCLLKNAKFIVDLCAAPGSWSQVAAKYSPRNDDRRIIAVDLRQINPIDGVTQLRGDITSQDTSEKIIKMLGSNKADIVMADGAPDIIGRVEFDGYVQHNIVKASLAIATLILEKGGSFISKVYRTRYVDHLYGIMGQFFDNITLCKPKASRLSSVECFVVCKGFHLPDNYVPSLMTENLPSGPVPDIEFMACGTSSSFESERTYPLSDDEYF